MLMGKPGFENIEQKSGAKYKDTFFRTFFHDEERVLELYNALEGTDYGKGTPLQFFTQGDKSLMRRNNDLAVVIDNQILSLKDHQGTINPNMPLRFLPNATDILYTWLQDKKNLYKNKLVTIPTPKFYVLYNGKEKLTQNVLKLSDAFRSAGHSFSLELEVKVIDINYSKDNIILQKSPSLGGYSYLIAQIRNRLNNETPRDKAIAQAVTHCIENGIISDFLRTNYKEVIDMFDWDITYEDELKIRIEEAVEEAVEEAAGKAHEKGFLQAAISLIKSGMNLKEVTSKLNLTDSQIGYLEEQLA